LTLSAFDDRSEGYIIFIKEIGKEAAPNDLIFRLAVPFFSRSNEEKAFP